MREIEKLAAGLAIFAKYGDVETQYPGVMFGGVSAELDVIYVDLPPGLVNTSDRADLESLGWGISDECWEFCT